MYRLTLALALLPLVSACGSAAGDGPDIGEPLPLTTCAPGVWLRPLDSCFCGQPVGDFGGTVPECLEADCEMRSVLVLTETSEAGESDVYFSAGSETLSMFSGRIDGRGSWGSGPGEMRIQWPGREWITEAECRSTELTLDHTVWTRAEAGLTRVVLDAWPSDVYTALSYSQ